VKRKHRRAAQKRASADGGGGAYDAYTSAVQHHRAGRVSEAERYYRRALDIDPDRPDILQSFAELLAAAGDPGAAFAVLARALLIRETDRAKAMFVGCLQRLRTPPDVPGLRTLFVRAMSEPWSRPSDLAPAAASLIKRDAVVNRCVARVETAWPRRLSERALFGADGTAAIAGDSLLLAALDAAPVCDEQLERFLTTLRSVLLDAASIDGSTADVDDAVLTVYCALARQCFNNEYAFALAGGELPKALALRDSVDEALGAKAPVLPIRLAAVAAYFPLHSLRGGRAVPERSWPAPVHALITQQVREPLEELRFRATIPRLTEVRDAVSRRVQQQYEENPYPRWLKVRAPGRVISVDALLRRQFPAAPFRPLGKTDGVDYLMAGCGTGQTTIEAARLLGGVRMLAVDLSMSSLAYAKRKAAESGVSGIEFAQADILELPSLERRFDVVNCSGVLHHLADPLAGWHVLVSLLRSGGFMRVAVYSATARQRVAAARAFAAARGFGPTPDDIRRCRQEILSLPDGDPVKMEARNSDFFSLSGCRDWLFHAWERPLALPEIGRFLGENGLDFIGFNVAPQVAARYTATFPHDPSLTDLASWHRFEQEHAASFIRMYQFWVQKR
jgi:2-polyprenyl-3-methyl-5-hydroxy-6-metoxy-1,4-benzoquinol methylase